MNPKHAQFIRQQATQAAYRKAAAAFLAMPWWKRLQLALFPRWL